MKIYFVTWPNGYFGSASQSWETLDIYKIINNLNYRAIIVSMIDILNIPLAKEDVVILNSSEDKSMRDYVRNIAFFLRKKCRIIPSYELILAHEDKGFQELMKSYYSFGNLKGKYFFDIDDSQLEFPKVLKTVSGAGSSGVFLVKSEKDIENIRKKYFLPNLARRVIKFQRKIKLNPEQYSIYQYRYKGFSCFVEQEFITSLHNDYKVLVFGDKYCVLKRNVRKNDFRASGSGNFEFVDPPIEVLDFAEKVANILNNPYLSLDVAQSSQGCHLIEFQATNFGPYTWLNAKKYFLRKDESWISMEHDQDLNKAFAYSINYFLGAVLDND